MLVAVEQRAREHEHDERGDEPAERQRLLHALDDRADEQRLRERDERADHTQHNDEGELTALLEEIGQQLAECGPRALRCWLSDPRTELRFRRGGFGGGSNLMHEGYLIWIRCSAAE